MATFLARYVFFSHATTLLPVTKARIALERRRFLKNAETAVQRQAMWSNLAHEMTAEFRGLCAEEAYLQQELEKLSDLRNKVKQEGELWDDLVSSSRQNSHLVSKATRIWESIMAHKGQHEVLASGPIEDLIAHREHRYRISGSAMLAAMDQSSQVPHADLLSVQLDDPVSTFTDNKELGDGSYANMHGEVKNSLDSPKSLANDETLSRVDDKAGRVNQSVDVAEIIRRWTHALQRIHKQSLLLVLINQLKEVAPAIQKSIAECIEEVNSLPPTLPPVTRSRSQPTSPLQSQGERIMDSVSNNVAELTSNMSHVQLENVPASSTLKLPQLFNSTPPSGKGGNVQKQHTLAPEINKMEILTEKSTEPRHGDNLPDSNGSFVQNLKRSVREAALYIPSSEGSPRDSHSDEGSEHYFVSLSAAGFSRIPSATKGPSVRSTRLFTSQSEPLLLESHVSDDNIRSKFSDIPDTFDDLDSLKDYDQGNGFLSAAGSNTVASEAQLSFYDVEESHDQVFSPPLLMDSALLSDAYEDLLAPLSETEAAFMEH